MGNQLKREDILNVQDLKYKTVDVPEWGGEVTIRPLDGVAFDKWANFVENCRADNGDMDTSGLRVQMLSISIVDPETKELLFTPDDITALSKKSSKAINRVYDAVEALNGVSEEGVEAAKKE